jgi:predicted GIY-YIG superfamily endonuclease
MIYLYQLQFNHSNPFYIGVSRDLAKRLRGHIHGAVKGQTAKDKFIRQHIGQRPLDIVTLGIFEDIDEAERVEKMLIDRSPWCLNIHHNGNLEMARREYYTWCPECEYGWINRTDNNKCAFRNINHGQSLLLARWTRDRNTGEIYDYTELYGDERLARRWW